MHKMRVYMHIFIYLSTLLALSDGRAMWREAPPVAGVPAAAGAARKARLRLLLRTRP